MHEEEATSRKYPKHLESIWGSIWATIWRRSTKNEVPGGNALRNSEAHPLGRAFAQNSLQGLGEGGRQGGREGTAFLGVPLAPPGVLPFSCFSRCGLSGRPLLEKTLCFLEWVLLWVPLAWSFLWFCVVFSRGGAPEVFLGRPEVFLGGLSSKKHHVFSSGSSLGSPWLGLFYSFALCFLEGGLPRSFWGLCPRETQCFLEWILLGVPSV